ncbi:MAG: DUF7487 domain-containing protein [bacterium]
MIDKKKIIEYLLIDNQSGYKTRENHLNKKFVNLIDEINIYHLKYFKDRNLKFTQQLYNYLYNITQIPKCKYCNKEIKWRGVFKEGYSTYCSLKCSNSSEDRNMNRKETNKIKYGVSHISQSELIKEKRQKTYLKKYGSKNIFENDKIKEKIKETNLKKYGTVYPIQSNEIKHKRVINNLKKYGVESPSKLDSVKDKNKKTCNKKYGVDSVMQVDVIKNKRLKSNIYNQNNLEKYKQLYGAYFDIKYLGNGNIIVKNQCKKHPEYEINNMLFYNRVNYNIKNPCPICYPKQDNSSINEHEIRKWIENDLKIKTIKHKINGFEIDIFLPDYNLGIEYNGLYWHSNKFKDKNYHLNKTELCEKNNIQLLHIFEDEWINKKEIIKSIIKSKLGLNKKIYARKCIIKEINSKTSREFLNKNHLQDNVNGSIRLGLFYNNELVSIMTFSKERRSLGNKKKNSYNYEMVRFCNKIGINVVGGASKLFKYFIRNNNYEKIISFADRRYSNGNLYKKLKFNFIYNTKPNYWYFKLSTFNREHRFKYRKDVLVKEGYNKDKTEFQIMNDNNYLQIYDSGNMKFEYKKNPLLYL